MITEQERIIRKSQGYDIGFEQDGKNTGLIAIHGMKKKGTYYLRRLA